jgi:glycosyltransferase involved in cell wall biosynthesis
VEASWDFIKGNQEFFNVTNAFRNALHGKKEEITAQMLDVFRDAIVIHDPQPSGLIDRKREARRSWVWRCHIDVSAPQPDVWNFLRPWIEQYDAAVFSMPDFAQRLPIPHRPVYRSVERQEQAARKEAYDANAREVPVTGGAVGGIKLQVIDRVTGFPVHSPEGAAARIMQLLRDRKLREHMGKNGYQHVR